MLKNDRYIGRSVWKRRMWVTDPATGARTYRTRGEDEWVTTEQPHLAIVTKDLWDRVHARFAERKGAKGRARGTGATGHLLTGLLRCGECGSTMRVVSLKRKTGRAYANFGCSAHHGKGSAICGNGLVISERKLNRAVIDELRKLLASKEIQARFIDGFTKRLQHKNPADDREQAALEAEVRSQGRHERRMPPPSASLSAAVLTGSRSIAASRARQERGPGWRRRRGDGRARRRGSVCPSAIA